MTMNSISRIFKKLRYNIMTRIVRIDVEIHIKTPYWPAKMHTYVVLFNRFKTETEFESVPLDNGTFPESRIIEISGYANNVSLYYGFDPFKKQEAGAQ